MTATVIIENAFPDAPPLKSGENPGEPPLLSEEGLRLARPAPLGPGRSLSLHSLLHFLCSHSIDKNSFSDQAQCWALETQS